MADESVSSSADDATGARASNGGWPRAIEGEVYEPHKKKVQHLIYQSERYVVYLDDELYVLWKVFRRKDGDKEASSAAELVYGEIVNRVTELEAVPIEELSERDRLAFKLMVGNGLARMIGEDRAENARDILHKARKYVDDRRSERARAQYLISAVLAAGVAMLLGAVLWGLREWASKGLGSGLVMCLVGGTVGCGGAFLSVLLRFDDLPIRPDTGTFQRAVAGGARILAGGLGGAITGLALRSDVLMGFTNIKSQNGLFMLLCVVAGFSERFVPSLLGQLEDEMRQDPGKPKDRQHQGGEVSQSASVPNARSEG